MLTWSLSFRDRLGGRMNIQKSYYLIIGSMIILSYNNCGRFSTLEDPQSLSFNSSQDASSVNDPNGNNDGIEIPSPMNPSPQPSLPPPTPQQENSNVPAGWSNMPAGLTTVVDCPWSDNQCNLTSAYAGQTTYYASPGGAGNPLSAPRAMKDFMAANSAQGNGVWNYPLNYTRQVYVGMWWSTSSTFEGYANNANKMFFVNAGNSGDNSFLVWYGNPGINNAKQIRWYQQGQVDNCHLDNFGPGAKYNRCWNTIGADHDGTGWFAPNVNPTAANVLPGSGWHKLEVFLQASTGPATKDGIVKVWVDGQLTNSNLNVNISPGGFEEFGINHAWDGVSCTLQARTCAYEWAHYWDHTVIAIKK